MTRKAAWHTGPGDDDDVPPPCERGCTLAGHCAEHAVACAAFLTWYHRGKAVPAPDDPRPTRACYQRAFPSTGHA